VAAPLHDLTSNVDRRKNWTPLRLLHGELLDFLVSHLLIKFTPID
jgi:hypothetical protein